MAKKIIMARTLNTYAHTFCRHFCGLVQAAIDSVNLPASGILSQHEPDL